MLRLASLEGSITSTLAALGRLDWLVAVGRHDRRLLDSDEWEAIKHLPQLPCTWAVKAADLEPLHADLVLASIPIRESSLAELLQSYPDMLILMPTNLESIYRNIRILGQVVSAADRAATVIADMRAGLEQIRGHVAELPRPRVYIEVWPRPFMNGPHWVAELVETYLNAEFVAGPGDRKNIPESEILEAQPDVIVVTWPGVDDPPLERVFGRPNWQDLPAIRRGHVRAIPEIWVNSPGPNLLKGAWELARAIHGIEVPAGSYRVGRTPR